MQTAFISNLFPGTVPVLNPSAPSVSQTQPNLPFAALFQVKLNTANAIGKAPAPGSPLEAPSEPAANASATQAPLQNEIQRWDATALLETIPNRSVPSAKRTVTQPGDDPNTAIASLENHSSSEAIAPSQVDVDQEKITSSLSPSGAIPLLPGFPTAYSGWLKSPAAGVTVRAIPKVAVVEANAIPQLSDPGRAQNALYNFASIATASSSNNAAHVDVLPVDTTQSKVIADGLTPVLNDFKGIALAELAPQAAPSSAISSAIATSEASNVAPNQHASDGLSVVPATHSRADTDDVPVPSLNVPVSVVAPQDVTPVGYRLKSIVPLGLIAQADPQPTILAAMGVPESSSILQNENASPGPKPSVTAMPRAAAARVRVPLRNLAPVSIAPTIVTPVLDGLKNLVSAYAISQPVLTTSVPAAKAAPESAPRTTTIDATPVAAPSDAYVVQPTPPNVPPPDTNSIPALPVQPANEGAASSAPSVDNALTQHDSSAPQQDSRNVVLNVTSVPNAQGPRAARADFRLLNLPEMDTLHPTTYITANAPQTSAENNNAQSDSKLTSGPSTASSASPAQTAAEASAIGAAALSNRPQAANAAQPVPVAAATSGPQSKDASNESQSNDSNQKNDRSSNSVGARTDAKGFTQSLDSVSVNPGIAPSPTDTTAATVATRIQPDSAPVSQNPKPVPTANESLRTPNPTPPTAGPNTVVNTARLLDGSGQTEIRIEMQGDSLGGIELRAHISGDQMGATIAVEHRDAQLALVTELPTLHSALAEKNIRLDTLSVSQGTFTSLSGGHGGDGGQKWFAQPRPNAIQAEQADPFVGLPDVQSEMTGTGVSNTGLSVLA